jgi:hypothetical protein
MERGTGTETLLGNSGLMAEPFRLKRTKSLASNSRGSLLLSFPRLQWKKDIKSIKKLLTFDS